MSREKKFTPGPWQYQTTSDAYTHIVRPSSKLGQIIVHLRQDTSGITEANANLIAAAPELLEALELARDRRPVVCACDLSLEDSSLLAVIESALSKAYGETK